VAKDRADRQVTKWLLAIVALVGVVLHGRATYAHDSGTTAFAAITVQGHMVRYKLTLSTIPSNLAERFGVGPPGARPAYALLAPAIARHIHLHADDRACRPGPQRTSPPTPLVVSTSASVDFVCPDPIGMLRIRDDLFDVLGNDIHTIARIDWSGGSEQFVFGPDNRSVSLVVSQRDAGTPGAGFGSFFFLGVEHILIGYDHLLFLLMLVVYGGALLQLLKIVTAFTVSHSITLALAAFDVVQLPSRIVEVAIALSVAWVAAENLWWRNSIAQRWAVAFAFGAVHGLGFSAVLKEAGLKGSHLAWSLLGFNLGVEAGQAVAVLAVLPLLSMLNRTAWNKWAFNGVSAAVLAFAAYLAALRCFS
jgi:HupE / UreJ protein